MRYKTFLVAAAVMLVLLVAAALLVNRGAGSTYSIYSIGSTTATPARGAATPARSTDTPVGSTEDNNDYLRELVSNSTVGKVASYFGKALDWFKGYVTFVVSGSRLDVLIKAAFVSIVLFALSYAVQVVRVLLQGLAVFTVLLAVAALLGLI